MGIWTRVVAVGAGAIVIAGAVFPTASGAAPIDEKRRQAAELQRQIEANDHAIVALSEKFNGARYRLSQAEAAIADAQSRMQASEAKRRTIRAALADRAAHLYRSAGSSTPLTQIDVSSVREIASRSKYASAAAELDDQLVAKLRNVEDGLAARRADLERQREVAKSEVKAADSARAQIAEKNRRARALSDQVRGEIAEIIREEEAARAAAATAQAAARQANQRRAPEPSNRSGQTPVTFVDVPAPNAGAAAAVAFAKAQVGKGYRFATAGPDTFDCSGLTSAAWARGGVTLTRYSGAQYRETIRIGRGDLQPGDLIFYGPNASDHVSMYVGGGMVVSASNPRVGVRYVPIYGSPMGYGRVSA